MNVYKVVGHYTKREWMVSAKNYADALFMIYALLEGEGETEKEIDEYELHTEFIIEASEPTIKPL